MLADLVPDPLAVLIAEGDPDGLAALYKRDGGWVYSLAERFVRGSAAAEAVTEEVFDVVWVELGGNGQPDLTLHGWLVRLTREIALAQIAEGTAAPNPDPWPLPPENTAVGQMVRALDPGSRNVLMRVWARAGKLGEAERAQLRTALTAIGATLPASLRSDPAGPDGLDIAEHLLLTLPPETEAAIMERLPSDPALRSLRRAWSEALAELAPKERVDAPAPEEVMDHLHEVPSRTGLRAVLREMDLIPFVIGALLASLVAFGAYHLDLIGFGSGPATYTAELRDDPLDPALFEVAYSPESTRFAIQGNTSLPISEPVVLWLTIGAGDEVKIGTMTAAAVQYFDSPVELPSDPSGTRLIARSLDGAEVAEGRLSLR